MNFNEAVVVHQRWKTKLRMAVAGAERLDPATVSSDNQCDLGKWLSGSESAECKSLPEFSELVKAHSEFHKIAGQIAEKVVVGDKDGAKVLLDGLFYETSSKTIMAITRCQKASK